jgi:signal transduction histidine kinase
LRQFISDASHDLNTPLTSIKALLWLIQQNPAASALLVDLANVEMQVERLERLVRDMLNMSRLDMADAEFQHVAIDINRLVRTVLAGRESLAARHKHTVNFTPAPDVPGISADEVHLSHALTNIYVNALHYTPEGGTISVRTYATASHVAIEIADTGIGISADDLPHIFDRFFRADKARQTATGGTGLGLAIALKIVEAHHGSIEVESTPGAGSTFTVLLPVE